MTVMSLAHTWYVRTWYEIFYCKSGSETRKRILVAVAARIS